MVFHFAATRCVGDECMFMPKGARLQVENGAFDDPAMAYSRGESDHDKSLFHTLPVRTVDLRALRPAELVYHNADLEQSGCRIGTEEFPGYMPISRIWLRRAPALDTKTNVSLPPTAMAVMVVYGLDLSKPLLVTHCPDKAKDYGTLRWAAWRGGEDGVLWVDLAGGLEEMACSRPLTASAEYRRWNDGICLYRTRLAEAYQAYSVKAKALEIADFAHSNVVFHMDRPKCRAIVDTYRIDMSVTAFRALVAEVLTSNDAWSLYKLVENGPLHRQELTIGKVSMTYRHETGKLTYINGIRVNKDDADYCLAAVARFQSTAEYNNLLREVSRTSLKLQKRLREGAMIALPVGDTVSMKSLQTHSRLSKFAWNTLSPPPQTGYNAFNALMGNVAGKVMDLPLALRKDFRKAMQVEFLGKWRTLDMRSDIDVFLNYCDGHGSSRTLLLIDEPQSQRYRPIGAPDVNFRLVSRLVNFDSLLSPADGVVPRSYLVPTSGKPGFSSIAPSMEAWTFFSDVKERLTTGLHEILEDKMAGVVQSLDLLERTVARYGIVEHLDNVGKVDYFLVTGESGSIYKVNLAGGVFKYRMAGTTSVSDIDEYICIDPASGHGSGSAIGFNYTVAIMLALTSDSFVAPSIYTLKNRLAAAALPAAATEGGGDGGGAQAVEQAAGDLSDATPAEIGGAGGEGGEE